MMINRAAYDKYGVPVPKTWDDVIAAGKALKPHGVQVMNLAGEDPSTLVNLVSRPAAPGTRTERRWKVDFLSAESCLRQHSSATGRRRPGRQPDLPGPTRPDRLLRPGQDGLAAHLHLATAELRAQLQEDPRRLAADRPAAVRRRLGVRHPGPRRQHACSSRRAVSTSRKPRGGVWMNTEKAGSTPPTTRPPAPTRGRARARPVALGRCLGVRDKLFGSHKSEASRSSSSPPARVDNWMVGPNYTGVFKELQDQWAQTSPRRSPCGSPRAHAEVHRRRPEGQGHQRRGLMRPRREGGVRMSLDLKQKPLVPSPAEQSGDVRAPSRRWRRTVALKGASFTVPFFARIRGLHRRPADHGAEQEPLQLEELRVLDSARRPSSSSASGTSSAGCGDGKFWATCCASGSSRSWSSRSSSSPAWRSRCCSTLSRRRAAGRFRIAMLCHTCARGSSPP